MYHKDPYYYIHWLGWVKPTDVTRTWLCKREITTVATLVVPTNGGQIGQSKDNFHKLRNAKIGNTLKVRGMQAKSFLNRIAFYVHTGKNEINYYCMLQNRFPFSLDMQVFVCSIQGYSWNLANCSLYQALNEMRGGRCSLASNFSETNHAVNVY